MEAEASLQEREIKRKTPDLGDQNTRKSKRRKLELLNNWGESSNLLEDDQMDNLPEGWWRTVDELSTKEANLITSGRHNTYGTSWKKPVGVTTILGNQGKDPVNSDPDKASETEAYEGLGPTPELSRQTHELVYDDNVPAGRKLSVTRTKASNSFKFKKKGRINSKEQEEIQRTHRSLFSWMKNPQSSSN